MLPLVLESQEPISNQSFIIKKTPTKRVSKNVLKEDVGQNMKLALQACATINKELGVLQQKVADVQTNLLANVESLIENKKKFKKANRGQLSEALSIMQQAERQLKFQGQNINAIKVAMNKNACLKDEAKTT